MLKRLVLVSCLLVPVTFSCAKTSSAKTKEASDTEQLQEVFKSEEITKEQKDLIKAVQVYNTMSTRFKNDIPLSSIQNTQFIQALNAVLNFEAGAYNETNETLGLLYLIDKKHNVGSEYEPKGLIPVKQCSLYNVSRNDLSLRPEAFHALDVLAEAAKADGITLMVSSTYRSYSYQERLFARYVKEDGEAEAERYSARPGTSQHQLGCAVDFGSITDDWGDTNMGKWVYENAAEYGWSLSFPRNYEDVTGYMWECWHFRYIGKDACMLQKEYFHNIQQYMLEFIDAWKNS